MTTSRFKSPIGYIAIMEGVHPYLQWDVGSRSCTAKAMLQEHSNKPAWMLHPPAGSSAPTGYIVLTFCKPVVHATFLAMIDNAEGISPELNKMVLDLLLLLAVDLRHADDPDEDRHTDAVVAQHS